MDAVLRGAVVQWFADALHSGSPLAPLPAEAMPRSVAAGSRIAGLVLEALDLVPCGLRLAAGPDGAMLAGPMLEGRLLPDDATVALSALRHPVAAPAILGVLADELPRRGDAMPSFATLHPAIDITGWRLRDPPSTAALAAADLAGLGLVVAGHGRTQAPVSLRCGFGAAGTRRRSVPVDIPAALMAAGAAARRAGGLPRGAILVAVIGPGVVPMAGSRLSASFAGLGTVRVGFT